MVMGSRSKVMRAALSVSFIWFLLLVISAESVNQLKLMEIENGALHQNFNLNYVSKRRVPKGPDPIHNRRAGSSKLPPT
ncbi:hypothetical protein Pfo_019631 [Paulownia fortunei]|nr:hypothetical protein Pfo_019631 [Paulownia fortunei]